MTTKAHGQHNTRRAAKPALHFVNTPSSRPSNKHGRGRILVGTASWTDPGFIADWYPEDVSAQNRLEWYATHFNLVEVNSTFYAAPNQIQVKKWCDQTPDGFVFDLKLHRLLSRHSTPVKFLPPNLRRLAGDDEKSIVTPRLEKALVDVIGEAIEPMVDAGKLGALLLQLSPSFGPRFHSLGELDHLLELLRDYRVAVELRNRGWVDESHEPETIAYFKSRRTSLVAVDGPPGDHFMIMPAVEIVTDRRLAYLRAHGRNTKGYVSGRSVAERFDYDYSEAELKQIADRARAFADIAQDTHIIYNNNKSDYAPRAAERFQRIVAAQSPQKGPTFAS
jgi:uncharacterized protein YecE (DUF72 family)